MDSAFADESRETANMAKSEVKVIMPEADSMFVSFQIIGNHYRTFARRQEFSCMHDGSPIVPTFCPL